MKKLSGLRIQLGLNQEQMAAWLGVSRSTYAMAETGRRSLPTSAYQKLGLVAAKTDAQTLPALPLALEEKQCALQQKVLQQIDFKRRMLERRLQRMQRKFEGLMNLLQAVTLLQPAQQDQHETHKDQLVVAVAGAGVERQLKSCMPLQQQLLQLEIDSLRWKAEQLAAGQ